MSKDRDKERLRIDRFVPVMIFYPFAFALVAKEIKDPGLVIGLKISRYFVNQSDVKPEPIVCVWRSNTFSRASHRRRVSFRAGEAFSASEALDHNRLG